MTIQRCLIDLASLSSLVTIRASHSLTKCYGRQGKRIGRPTTHAALLDQARIELAKGTGILKTTRLIGIGVGAVQKLKKEMLVQAQHRRASL
jgi:hypothetical protein